MKRRDVLKAAGVGIAGSTALPIPAVAQSMPELRWRMASSFPKSLETLYGATETIAKYVSDATDGRFRIHGFQGGELFPALHVTDKIQDGTVELGHTALYYSWGKDPTFALAACVPFGLNSRLQNAWWFSGGGREVMNEFLAGYNLFAIAAGNTGTQMGGWFRREIKSLDDIQGLKFRISGLGGAVMSRIGVIPQQISGTDVYPALEKGAIDAAEWVGPFDDQKLGFDRVAPYYYYPGWWEGGTMGHLIVALDKWNGLPRSYQTILIAAGAYANEEMLAKYDILNPKALRDLVAGGTVLRPYPMDVMEACFTAATNYYAELSSSNVHFQKVYKSMAVVRQEGFLWLQVAEQSFDSFMMRQQRANLI